MRRGVLTALAVCLVGAGTAPAEEATSSSPQAEAGASTPPPFPKCDGEPFDVIPCVSGVLGHLPPWPDRNEDQRAWHRDDALVRLSAAARSDGLADTYFVAAKTGLLGLSTDARDKDSADAICSWAREQISRGCVYLSCPDGSNTREPIEAIVHTAAEHAARTRIAAACGIELTECSAYTRCVGVFAPLHASYSALLRVDGQLRTMRAGGEDVSAEIARVRVWSTALDDITSAREAQVINGTLDGSASVATDIEFKRRVEGPTLAASESRWLAYLGRKFVTDEAARRRLAEARRELDRAVQAYDALPEHCPAPAGRRNCTVALDKLVDMTKFRTSLVQR